MGHRDNMSDDGDTGGSGLYQVMWSPDLVKDMDQSRRYVKKLVGISYCYVSTVFIIGNYYYDFFR